MPRKIPSYIACEEGNTAIEFAFVMPILVLFIFGMIQFGFLIFEQATLQGSLSSAAREGKTGYPSTSDPGSQCTGGTCQCASGPCGCPTNCTQTAQSGLTLNATNIGQRWKQIDRILMNLTAGLFDPTQIILTVTSYDNFTDLEAAMNSGTLLTGGAQNNMGTGGQVVVYVATYPAPTYLNPILGLGNGKGVITAITIERNEGF